MTFTRRRVWEIVIEGNLVLCSLYGRPPITSHPVATTMVISNPAYNRHNSPVTFGSKCNFYFLPVTFHFHFLDALASLESTQVGESVSQ